MISSIIILLTNLVALPASLFVLYAPVAILYDYRRELITGMWRAFCTFMVGSFALWCLKKIAWAAQYNLEHDNQDDTRYLIWFVFIVLEVGAVAVFLSLGRATFFL